MTLLWRTLERQDLSLMYLAHHELESDVIIIVITDGSYQWAASTLEQDCTCPKAAVLLATMISHIMASSQPPPKA